MNYSSAANEALYWTNVAQLIWQVHYCQIYSQTLIIVALDCDINAPDVGGSDTFSKAVPLGERRLNDTQCITDPCRATNNFQIRTADICINKSTI